MGRSYKRLLGMFLILVLLGLCQGAVGQCFKSSKDSSTTETSTNPTTSSANESEDLQSRLNGKKLEFTLDMFHKLYNKEEKKNLFFSPHSIHQALMMAFFGSQGQTEKELRQALSLENELSKEELIKAYKMEAFYQETRSANTTQYELRVANKLYFSKDEPIRQCVQEIFSKEIELLNFGNETEESRDKINSWVEEETNGKIKDIIPPGYIAPESRIAIVNSAYFKGNWEQQFKKSNTKLSLFYVSQKEVTPTMMMYQKGSFRHGVSEALKSYILELPYEGEALSLMILLPPFTPNALEETISRLNSSTLREAMDEMYADSIEVFLPKFKIQQSFELSKTLKSIGIVDLFDQNSSNLKDFSDKPGLSIESARHKSYLEVNEEGSTAAAATALIGTRSGRPLDQTRFICNHPFVFFIMDNTSKNILFIGSFQTPKVEK